MSKETYVKKYMNFQLPDYHVLFIIIIMKVGRCKETKRFCDIVL